MDRDGRAVLDAYLEHLSDDDLRVVATSAPRVGLDGELQSGPAAAIRAKPELLVPLLAAPETFRAIFGPRSAEVVDEVMLGVSPFLVFAVAVERCRVDLDGAAFVSEWFGPKRRVPVLGALDLNDFLSDPWRRLFLAGLLGSYTHVASGAVLVRTRRGWRRQRFSELDPVRLAGLLEVVPEAERPGVYRRLGDLALFLTGVFPDHTATSGFGPVAETRLLRAARLSGPDPSSGATLRVGMGDAGAVGLLERLGRQWYRLAAESVPPPRPRQLDVVVQLIERFGEARRILNALTDRYLFPFRDRWFGQR